MAMAEVTKLEDKLADLEENLAKTKDMAKEANDKTTDLGKESQEALRVARVLKNKNNTEDGQVTALEKQLEQSVLIEKEAEAKYEEVIRKLKIVESKLEHVDKRAADSDKIKIMDAKCKEVEGRADMSEKSVGKLQEEADRLEGLLGEVVAKNKKVEGEMEAAFQDLRNM